MILSSMRSQHSHSVTQQNDNKDKLKVFIDTLNGKDPKDK